MTSREGHASPRDSEKWDGADCLRVSEHGVARDQEKESASPEVTRLERSRESLQTVNKNLLVTIQDLQDRENFLKCKINHAELFLLQSQVDNKKLYDENIVLREKEKTLRAANAKLTDLSDRKQREMENLREEVVGLQYQLEDAGTAQGQ